MADTATANPKGLSIKDFRNPLYLLLIFGPIAFFLHDSLDPSLVFIFSAIAIIPLAKIVGEATEELAIHTGPRIGGLLNATLGNAAELIITLFALQEGLNDLVRASITGSIIGNLLFVLGLSLFLGGLKNGIQTFDRRNAGMYGILIILAVFALAIPSLFDVAIQDDFVAEERLSEGVAIIMIVLYGASVYYSFTQGSVTGHSEGEHEESRWTVAQSLVVLALATIGIVLMSETLVGAVEDVTETLGLTEIFIGLIIIPLVGNVAEHLVAVQVAIKNKMELSLSISLGSSLQIALFVAPVLVFANLLINEEALLLVFTSFELIVLVGSAVIAAFIGQDGESNWLEGLMLIMVYFIIALAFLVLPELHEVAEAAGAGHGG